MHSEGNVVYGACRRRPIKDEEWRGPTETEAGVTGGGAGEMDWRGQRLWGRRGKGEGKLGSPGVIHIPDSQLLLTQNLQVKWENEWRVTTDVLLCTQYLHFPYLVASHLHPCYALSCPLLHGAQWQDEWEANGPRTSLYNRESSSVDLWASYLWGFTVSWVFNKSSYNSLWKQPVIFIPFFKNNRPTSGERKQRWFKQVEKHQGAQQPHTLDSSFMTTFLSFFCIMSAYFLEVNFHFL